MICQIISNFEIPSYIHSTPDELREASLMFPGVPNISPEIISECNVGQKKTERELTDEILLMNNEARKICFKCEAEEIVLEPSCSRGSNIRPIG